MQTRLLMRTAAAVRIPPLIFVTRSTAVGAQYESLLYSISEK